MNKAVLQIGEAAVEEPSEVVAAASAPAVGDAASFVSSVHRYEEVGIVEISFHTLLLLTNPSSAYSTSLHAANLGHLVS